jgi:glycogen debranching enzyme
MDNIIKFAPGSGVSKFNHIQHKNSSTQKPQNRKKPDQVVDLSRLKSGFISFKGATSSEILDSLKREDPEIRLYTDQLASIEQGKLLKDTLKAIEGIDRTACKDLFKTLSGINATDRESVMLLAGIAKNLKSGAKLEYGANIQDAWLERIVKHPHFSEIDKNNTIIRSCKSTNMGHVIKNENLFINATELGNIPGSENYGHKDMGESKAYGLYTNDTAFLSNYTLNILDNSSPLNLKLKNCTISEGKSDYKIKGPGVEVDRKQVINSTFYDRIKIKNNDSKPKTVKIDLESQIRDIIHVRSMEPPAGPFEIKELPDNKGFILNTSFGTDRNLGVKVEILADGKPVKTDINSKTENAITARIPVAGGQEKSIDVKVTPVLNEKPFVNGKEVSKVPETIQEAEKNLTKKDNSATTKVEISGHKRLQKADAILERAVDDLKLMTNVLNVDGKDYRYIVAGVPRYACLFGRDSIITALELLPVNQELAKDTALLLAKFQGKSLEAKINEEKAKNPGADIEKIKERYIEQEEAEGKILHELRVGELAREEKIPSTPYYGTVDATPLWLTLVSNYHKWSGDDTTVKQLLPQIEKALNWIDNNSPDGFLRFVGTHGKKNAIANQGWKDSEDSIKHLLDKKGKISNPDYPIALAEVQAYVYEAKKNVAEVYKKLGMPEKAQQLAKEADKLKQHFNEKYWVEDENFIAISLDASGNAIPSVTTNGGQCLRTGIVDEDKAKLMEKRIMSDDMNSGWGIRTLNKNSVAFDEMSYHNGSVWPHDTALVAKGLSRENMAEIATNLYEAAGTFPYNRIPELYAGFQRKPEDTEVQTYPESCSPQAWSSAALVDLMVSSLGVKPDAQNNTLILENPVLPEDLNKIKIDNLHINNKPINLVVSKTPDGNLAVKATSLEGEPLKIQKNNQNYIIYSN